MKKSLSIFPYMKTREEIVANFKNGLASFMGRSRFSMNSLAKATGMSTANVHQMSHGKTLPALDKVANLIDEGMTAEEIFGKELAGKLNKNAWLAGKGEAAQADGNNPYDILEGGLAAMLEKVRNARNA